MAARKKSAATATASPARKRRAPSLGFDALRIDGGLLSADWLTKVAERAASHQTDEAYRVHRGLQLRDEIGRYWRIAGRLWSEFVTGRAGGGDRAALTERFVRELLVDVFGFASLAPQAPVTIGDATFPIGFSALGGTVPVVVSALHEAPGPATRTSLVDVADARFASEGRSRSAFGLAQEFLNAASTALWGVATNGLTLAILRDNESLTRPARIEADLERIFSDGLYADFAALWLLLHESRFGTPGKPAEDCILEQWRAEGLQAGIPAREKLRDGVEAALLELGRGFLEHPANEALRAFLRSKASREEAYKQQLLRVVYRLIFLLTVEERELLHPPGTANAARDLYADGFSVRRLALRARRRLARDQHHDAWDTLRITFRGLAHGEPRLGLPALAGLFAANQCPEVDAARITNARLFAALESLAWTKTDAGLTKVNWRDKGPEELGSVYESLLELRFVVSTERRELDYAKGAETQGNDRKKSGSYYTPEDLVNLLLDSALDPVIEARLAASPQDPIGALLGLSIVDPSCGSGHFLLGAARRVAGRIARIRVNGTPTQADFQHALREVVAHCVYGVDQNPMAVELCKVALWMEAVDPGLPLTFLDSHIQLGNALLGTTPELMGKGVPDDAWEPLEGDDRKVASALKKRNKFKTIDEEGKTLVQREFALERRPPPAPKENELETLRTAVQALDAASDADVAALARKESEWAQIQDSKAYTHQRFVADAWCSAFVWPKEAATADAAPVDGLWGQFYKGLGIVPAETRRIVAELASKYRFFHWHLAFPQVYANGGFDVVLGNPPWERVKLQQQEFFAARDPAIAGAENAAARKKLVNTLIVRDPHLWEEWLTASRVAEGESHFIRKSGRYPLCGKGDVNTYAIFAEHNRSSLGPRGRAGFIVPTNIATDDTTKDYFATLAGQRELASFLSFENEEFLFSEVHHAFKFALLTVDRAGSSDRSDLAFFLRQAREASDKSRHFTLSPDDFALLNPNTRTCPTFRSKRDAEINLAMYRRTGVLWREDSPDGNPWGLRFSRLFDMANDSGLFRGRKELLAAGWRLEGSHFVLDGQRCLPLYEAKMVHHFDHRFGTYEGQTEAQENQGKLPEFDDAAHADPGRTTLPYYWVPADEVATRLDDRWDREWLLGWRDICRSTDKRTVIASLVPRAAVGHTTPLLMPAARPQTIAALYGLMCSFAFDYVARQKLGGTHLTYSYLKQFASPPPARFAEGAPWAAGISAAEWLLPRILELTYTAWDLQPFAEDVGYEGPPFRWDPDRRFVLRAELDAAFFHLYGLSRDDTDYVMDTFRIVKEADEKKFGRFRTKDAILAAYDEMARAIAGGAPFRSSLDVPPADPRVAHQARG